MTQTFVYKISSKVNYYSLETGSYQLIKTNCITEISNVIILWIFITENIKNTVSLGKV